jgi:hypothetical protein
VSRPTMQVPGWHVFAFFSEALYMLSGNNP